MPQLLERPMTAKPSYLPQVEAAFHAHKHEWAGLFRARMSQAFRAARDPEDILHDAWVRAQRRIGSFNRWIESRPPADRDLEAMAFFWLNRVVLNTFTDALRALHAQARDPARQVGLPDGSAGLLDSLTSPSGKLGRKEMRQRVHDILARMSPDDQQALSLRALQEASTEEVARALGITPAAARQRLVRAMLRFKDLWVQTYGNEGLPT